MKTFLNIVIIAIVFPGLYSCKKDSSTAKTRHTITYRISSNNYTPLSNITYKDSTTAPVPSSAADSTTGWSKSTMAFTPFSAELQVQGINNSSADLIFTMEIDEDGILKSSKQQTAAPFSSFAATLSAQIQ